MNAELHRLRYKIREQKKLLQANRKLVRKFVKQMRTKQLRQLAGRLIMSEDESKLLPVMERRLAEINAGLATINEINRVKYAPQRKTLELTRSKRQTAEQ